MTKKILLLGPPVGSYVSKAYGGGTGGYTRKMQLYLEHFKSLDFEQVPCFQTVRGQRVRLGLIGRLFLDVYRFILGTTTEKIAGVHMLGQYRGAMPREFCIALIARLRGLPYVYEIKAGVFVKWYERTNFLNRLMMRYVLKKASAVLGQGVPYIDFLRVNFQISAIYFPNFVSSRELQAFQVRQLKDEEVKILFVGYAFRAKGIFELVEACRELADEFNIQLTTIGKEDDEFKSWADQLPAKDQFKLLRLGQLPHEQVLEVYADNDIYCYPTKHGGEGHNNTINEAMMSGLVVITTKVGFLESIIGEERGYLLEDGTVSAISQMIKNVLVNKEEAIHKTTIARKFLVENFLDQVAFEKLERAYKKLTQK